MPVSARAQALPTPLPLHSPAHRQAQCLLPHAHGAPWAVLVFVEPLVTVAPVPLWFLAQPKPHGGRRPVGGRGHLAGVDAGWQCAQGLEGWTGPHLPSAIGCTRETQPRVTPAWGAVAGPVTVTGAQGFCFSQNSTPAGGRSAALLHPHCVALRVSSPQEGQGLPGCHLQGPGGQCPWCQVTCPHTAVSPA